MSMPKMSADCRFIIFWARFTRWLGRAMPYALLPASPPIVFEPAFYVLHRFTDFFTSAMASALVVHDDATPVDIYL